MNKHKFAVLVSIVMLGIGLAALLLATTNAAASPPAQAPTTVEAQAASSPVLHYQGRLIDPSTGNPKPNGTYNMTFRLYDVEMGGTALWSEAKSVFVGNGLFSTYLGQSTPLPLTSFDGRNLWLGITVGTDPEAVPRAALSPSPYAISLIPGAWISGSISGSAGILRATNTGQGAALVGLATSSTGTTYGVYGSASGTTGTTYGVLGNAFSPNGAGVAGYSNVGTAVDGYSDFGVGVKGNTGGTWGLYTDQHLYVGSGCTGCTIAFVGQNADTGTLEVGDVVAISGIAPPLNGQQTPVLKVRRATATSGGVLGVVQARAMVTATDVPALSSRPAQKDIMDIPNIASGRVAPGEHLFVVVQGLVQVRVNASSSAIQVGDALVSSATAGVVQKLSPDTSTAPMLGRALEPITSGTGLIWVMILGR